VESRADFLRELTKTIALNEYNLPRYLYRPDLVDHTAAAFTAPLTEESAKSAQEMLDNALINLSYDHGYPTLPDGSPLWNRFPFESEDSYTAFSEYLAAHGARTLHDIPSWPIDALQGWFHLYYWRHRALAFDMFRTVHMNRMRVQRIMKTDDTYYLQAEAIVGRLSKALNGKTDEELAQIEADKLIGMLEKTQRIQRIALGLPAAGPAAADESGSPLSVELTLRNIAKRNTPSRDVDTEADLQELYDDPEMLEAAQELVLKIGKK
jgi:hypothetical protein